MKPNSLLFATDASRSLIAPGAAQAGIVPFAAWEKDEGQIYGTSASVDTDAVHIASHYHMAGRVDSKVPFYIELTPGQLGRLQGDSVVYRTARLGEPTTVSVPTNSGGAKTMTIADRDDVDVETLFAGLVTYAYADDIYLVRRARPAAIESFRNARLQGKGIADSLRAAIVTARGMNMEPGQSVQVLQNLVSLHDRNEKTAREQLAGTGADDIARKVGALTAQLPEAVKLKWLALSGASVHRAAQTSKRMVKRIHQVHYSRSVAPGSALGLLARLRQAVIDFAENIGDSVGIQTSGPEVEIVKGIGILAVAATRALPPAMLTKDRS